MPAAPAVDPGDPVRSHGRQPDDDYFDLMAGVARTHWWYRARRAWLRQQVAGRLPPRASAVDAGTGTGATLDLLRAAGAATTVGTDLSEAALRHARPEPVLRARSEALPFRTASVDCLVSTDVIEHLDDDELGLAEYRRVLRPDGVLCLTVPAYRWLWSEHDERAAHRRRYSRGELLGVVERSGFVVAHATYLFSFLVPPAVALRRTPLGRLAPATDEEASSFHPLADAALAGAAAVERAWLARGGSIPFGLTVACVARAPGRPR